MSVFYNINIQLDCGNIKRINCAPKQFTDQNKVTDKNVKTNSLSLKKYNITCQW